MANVVGSHAPDYYTHAILLEQRLDAPSVILKYMEMLEQFSCQETAIGFRTEGHCPASKQKASGACSHIAMGK